MGDDTEDYAAILAAADADTGSIPFEYAGDLLREATRLRDRGDMAAAFEKLMQAVHAVMVEATEITDALGDRVEELEALSS